MVRRFIRLAFRLGLLAAIGFALLKLVQSRRALSSLSGGSEWAAAAKRPVPSGRQAGETALVEPSMLNGLSLKKAAQTAAGTDNGETGAATGSGPQPGVEPSAAAGFPVVPERRAPTSAPETVAASAPPQVASETAPVSPAREAQTTAQAAAANGSRKRAGAAKKATKSSRAAKATSTAKRAARAWVEPKGAFCPSTHPIKAKLTSGIYHLPGMTAYARTHADRCYQDEKRAQADGLRKAKR